MKPVRRLIPWLALVVIGGGIWILSSGSPEQIRGENPESDIIRSHQGGRLDPPGGANPAAAIPGLPRETTPAEVGRLLARCLDAFRNSRHTADSLETLETLRNGIRSSNPANAISAIHGFLNSGQDAPTKLPFAVGPGGMMETTPTLRTALLDLAPSLDPSLALQISREIMDAKKSPDEFALALRNLAWNDLDGDSAEELSDRFKQMIETGAWLSDPSAGFLEALDAAVAVADGNVFGEMLALSAKANSGQQGDLARAAMVALDRMVLRDPGLLVSSFGLDPALSGISPDQRASLMSRLDLRDPVQRDLFSRYVTGSNHGEGELDYFAELFPNGNYLHGNWLITSLDPTLSLQDRFEADRKVLAELERMIAGAKQSNQTIVQIRDRLQRVITKPANE